MNLIIDIPAPDALSQVTYRYYLIRDMDMVLNEVVHYTRPTKRHDWKVANKWSRTSGRDNTMERPEPPQEVKDEVRRRVNEAMRFI